ncbi:hypothetical protein WJX81_002779 [Elliptochloris bilobata]|uniref:Dynein light chain n=1 Tax=Elliptochloris bilobata TaxID=381761 RepID=A0AAW1QWM2_9CHLO
MAKATSIKEAIQKFEKDKEAVASAAEKVEIQAQIPPIERMDASLSSLKACRHLSLSTNNIEKITNLAGLDNLQILSLGRNQIKKLENLDPLAETLQELWVLKRLPNLKKLDGLPVEVEEREAALAARA